jgi:hypothetical protein
MEGDNDCYFSCDTIDVSGISPSALANSGLLMAAFVSEGEEVASVNMVSKQKLCIPLCICIYIYIYVCIYIHINLNT